MMMSMIENFLAEEKMQKVRAQEALLEQEALAQQQLAHKNAQFVPLTGAIITYIVDLMKHEEHPTYSSPALRLRPRFTNADIILNVYQAFECFAGTEEEDALWDYKKNIQRFIANYLFGEVMEQLQAMRYNMLFKDIITITEDFQPLTWYDSTDREVMYFYDILFCNPETLLHGRDYAVLQQTITAELFDCNYYLNRLRNDYENTTVHIPLISRFEIPMVRFLEEALYNKSASTISCIIQSGMYNKHMPLYLYLKHNHKVWGAINPQRSLVDNDMLFDMLLNVADEDTKSLLLEIAIGGLFVKNTSEVYLLNNVVHPNLALVKKIVPNHLPRDKEFSCLLGESSIGIFAMKPNEFALNRRATERTPYARWKEYSTRQLYAPRFANGSYEVCKIPRNAEIGDYLLC